MLSKRELDDAIRECENAPVNYQNCDKLATFYTIHDHLYNTEPRATAKEETVIGGYGDSDFLVAVEGQDAPEVWALMDELMTTLQAINPRLYDGVMRQLK